MFRRIWNGFLIFLCVLAWALIGGYWLLSPPETEEQIAAREAKEQRQDFEGNARVVCSMRIEESLRNPDTVDWNDRFAWPVIDDGENLHTVIAKYRAENGFGGMVSETRQCLVLRREDSATVLGIE